MQPNLFQTDAFGGTTPAPLAATADPETSHQAAREHKASGKLKQHAAIALALVRRHPGKTFREMFALARPEESFELGDAIELMRRLGGLKSCTPQVVKHGEARKCSVTKKSCVVWELA